VGAFRLWSDEIEAMRPEARAVIEAGRASMLLDAKPPPGLSVAEQVELAREGMVKVTFPIPEAEAVEIAGVPCRVIRPAGDARAVYLHFHGGGMISGSASLMDIPNQMLANELSVAALRVRDELNAIDRVDGLNLTYGIYDFGGTPSQRGVRPSDGFDILSPDFVALVADCYLPDRTSEERQAPDISPAYADLRGLPPCFVSVGTCDHLLDDSLLFAARAAASGVEVDLFVLPELTHAFQMFDCGITRAWSAAQTTWMTARLG
jgi:acetyl esterase/lipase